MADVSNELVYEVLKQVQRRVDQVDHKVDELRSELNAIPGHQLSMHQDAHNVYGILAGRNDGLERTELRLELNDAPTWS